MKKRKIKKKKLRTTMILSLLFFINLICTPKTDAISISTEKISNINNVQKNNDVTMHAKKIIAVTDSVPQHIEVDTTEVKEIKKKKEVKRDDDKITHAIAGVEPYDGYIDEDTDLRNRSNITVDQMNKIIDHWLDGRDSELKNQGSAFIKAANKTGLDPIFLLALAAHESGWEVSELHASKNNPYSINMIDADPTEGYVMGDTFSDGIINGAIWINKYYYKEGQTTLYKMIYGVKQYSSTTDTWIKDIRCIMNSSYKIISK